MSKKAFDKIAEGMKEAIQIAGGGRMDDLVVRLDNEAQSPTGPTERNSTTRQLHREAADEIRRLLAALRIIAGQEQCVDNLMSNVDVAREALTPMHRRGELRQNPK